MKKQNENLSLIILLIIVITTAGFIIFSFINSNKNLSYNNSKTGTNYTKNEKDVDIYKNNADMVKDVPKIIETEIASYTSTLYDKDQNRVDNISLAISKINNVIIKRGEEFSFNSTVGPMDEEHGFKKAVGFDANGNKIQVSGGGMCQISSTMYNAALIANLEITERHPHSRRVYYVPKDKDATIFYGQLDLKFINNTENDIKILATNNEQDVTIKLVKLENENKK